MITFLKNVVWKGQIKDIEYILCVKVKTETDEIEDCNLEIITKGEIEHREFIAILLAPRDLQQRVFVSNENSGEFTL